MSSVYTVSIADSLKVIVAKIREGSSGTVGTGLPGRYGVDYQFINEATVDIYVNQNKVCRHNAFR